MAAVGGTISEVTGGDFANGATTAAIGYIYNQRSRLRRNPSYTREDIDLALSEAFTDLLEEVPQHATDKSSAAVIIAEKLVPLTDKFGIEIGADFGCIKTECYISRINTDYDPNQLSKSYLLHTHPSQGGHLSFSRLDIESALLDDRNGSFVAASTNNTIRVLLFQEIKALAAVGRGEVTKSDLISNRGGIFVENVN